MDNQRSSKTMAILFDSTRCIGCRSCEEACDEENGSRKRKWSQEKHGDFRKPPAGLSGDKWIAMSHHPLPNRKPLEKPFNWDDAPELMDEGQYAYIRHACMHCVDPACVSACLVGALTKQENGAVIYNPDKCIGCRYCMIACPFSIPKWEWHEPLPYIRKCTLCYPRLKVGKIPACVENCPGNEAGPALVFGNRDKLVYEAKKRIHQSPNQYYPRVFGEKELGGTGVLYIFNRNLSLSEIGFPGRLSTRSIPSYTEGPMSTVPYWVGGFAALFSGLNWIIKRRDKLMSENNKTQKEEKK